MCEMFPSYNYQLCTFMLMDEFGDGQVVQHSLLETNGDWHMSRAIDHFVRAHENTKMLRVIVVDKDLNEIRVLKNAFPEAKVLICHFHVIKWLSHMAKQPEYGKISSENKKQVDHLVHNMVYAASEAVYEANLLSLQTLCIRVGFKEFYDYFLRNWDNCQEMWVLHRRSKLPHFKNHTNNRLESFFGKLKGVVHGDMSMTECLEKIIAALRRDQKEYEHIQRSPGQFYNGNYDEEMSVVLRLTNHYVAEQIEVEYVAAVAKVETYKFEVEGGEDAVFVRGHHQTHRVSYLDWSCDCTFSRTMRLPCRHAIAVRKSATVPVIGGAIPVSRIEARYRNKSFHRFV